jgi:hypothetical protein
MSGVVIAINTLYILKERVRLKRSLTYKSIIISKFFGII